MIVGTDEVGYGAIAGSLYVAGVAVSPSWRLEGVRDSKKMSYGARGALFPKLIEEVRGQWSVATATVEEVNKEGVWRALVRCHRSVILDLTSRFQVSTVVVDGSLDLGIAGVTSTPKADDSVPAVSAASIIAKVLRDEEMQFWDTVFPDYGFARHKGYGTQFHIEKIKKFGLCPLHRTYPKVLRLVSEEKSVLPS